MISQERLRHLTMVLRQSLARQIIEIEQGSLPNRRRSLGGDETAGTIAGADAAITRAGANPVTAVIMAAGDDANDPQASSGGATPHDGYEHDICS